MQRQRLTDLMNSIDYQRKQARRILIALCLLGIIALLMAAVTSCTSPPLPVSESPPLESRAAIPAVRDQDTTGRYILPVCPRCGAHPIDLWTGYHCGAGHTFETRNKPLSHERRRP